PVGSPEHASVLDYIVGEARTIGLDTEVQRTSGFRRSRTGQVQGAAVENIVARLPGKNNTRAVLLAGHYDSVATGPGASDDGSAVATMLETARALKAGPPLGNDLIFLFTDAEEVGLLGAQAFVTENPAVKNVGVVFNLEARGNEGATLMFETSADN